jgi:hypothetical protein
VERCSWRWPGSSASSQALDLDLVPVRRAGAHHHARRLRPGVGCPAAGRGMAVASPCSVRGGHPSGSGGNGKRNEAATTYSLRAVSAQSSYRSTIALACYLPMANSSYPPVQYSSSSMVTTCRKRRLVNSSACCHSGLGRPRAGACPSHGSRPGKAPKSERTPDTARSLAHCEDDARSSSSIPTIRRMRHSQYSRRQPCRSGTESGG